MSKRKKTTSPPPSGPEIFEASLGPNGAVVKGAAITQAEAEAKRRAGQDVVVCGANLTSNRSLAGAIERAANGTAKRCPPHASSGPNALPHYQPDPRPPAGHTFVKPHTEKPFERIMKFFTPELYIQFNSLDDQEAARADAEWEAAVRAYREHLQLLHNKMPSQVRKLAGLCLHDAEILAWEQSSEPIGEPFPHWRSYAILSVRQGHEITSLIYVLWDRVRECPSPEVWPFSNQRPHWLYDEVDVANPAMFLHRVLVSDGTTLEIPFLSALIHRLSCQEKA